MKVTRTGQKYGIVAMSAALSAGIDRDKALTVGAYAMMGIGTKLTESAQLHPENLKAARTEMVRVAMMTGLWQLQVEVKADNQDGGR